MSQQKQFSYENEIIQSCTPGHGMTELTEVARVEIENILDNGYDSFIVVGIPQGHKLGETNLTRETFEYITTAEALAPSADQPRLTH